MPAENNILARSFLDAVRKDDIIAARSLLANPELLDNCATLWNKNPLLKACECGSFRVAKEIAKSKPEFASKKNPDVCTAMLLACDKGDLLMVIVLAGINSQLCFVKDNSSMIPLQIAVVKGHDEMIRALIDASPNSLTKLISQKETVLHLALKNYQSAGTFEVLLEELKKQNHLPNLLNRKDHEGNTVLHIGVSNKLVEIVELLLPAESSSNQFVMKVNSVNKSGKTALDLYYNLTPRDPAAQKISHILSKAGAVERSATKTVKIRTRRRRPPLALEASNVMLGFLAMIAGAALAVTCSLPEPLKKKNVVAHATYHVTSITSLISLQLPPSFYLLVFNAASFMGSMVTIAMLTWELPFGALLVFVMFSISMVFVIVVEYVMPKFSVEVGSRNISSFLLVWILATTFIVFGTVVVSMVKRLISWVLKEQDAESKREN